MCLVHVIHERKSLVQASISLLAAFCGLLSASYLSDRSLVFVSVCAAHACVRVCGLYVCYAKRCWYASDLFLPPWGPQHGEKRHVSVYE